MLTGEAPSAIHWLEELGVEFTRENGGYRLARCGGASRKRLLQVGDRTGHAITTALRDASESSGIRHVVPKSPLADLERTENGWRARCGEHDDRAGDGRPRRGRALLPGGARSAASSRRTIPARPAR